VRKNVLIVGVIVALVLLFDQIIKVYVKTHFEPSFGVNSGHPILGDWFVMEYIENQGMAFGTTFGHSIWHKLALSVFRIIAIILICYYWFKQAKSGAPRGFLISLGLVLAGATGNLIDSMVYDFIFPIDPCLPWNHLDPETWGCNEPMRNNGFLLGNVVDMFKFHAFWPEWMPWLGGKEVFPAIWNLADASISIGVIVIFIRQRSYFPRNRKAVKVSNESTETYDSTEVDAPKNEQ
jgi:signal peptidase II